MSQPNRACSRVRALLSEFLDGRLEPKVARAIRLHLVQCEACTHEERALLALSRAARCMPHEIPSPSFAQDVRARDRGWLDLRTVLLVAAGLLVSAAIGVLAYQQGFQGGRAEERRRIAATEDIQQRDQAETPDPGSAEPPPLDRAPVGDGLAVDHTEVPVLLDPVLEDPDPAPQDAARPKAQLASWIPDDHQAVRATQSLFADLDLLDSVPAELHRPMLQSQLKYFELDRWATSDAHDRPGAVEDIAALVRQMMDGLEAQADPRQLVQLRRASDRENLWDDAYAATQATGSTGTRPELAPFVSTFAGDLPEGTQESLRDWLLTKDRWVQGSEDASDLLVLIESLPRIWMMSGIDPDITADFQLPNLEEMLGEIEWTVTEDGARRGELSIRSQGIHSFRSIIVVIETR